MKNRYRYYIITFVRRAANPKKVLCRIRLQIEISAALSGFFDDSGSNAVWKMVKGEEQMERDILLLGDPRLYEISEEIKREELDGLRPVIADLFACIKGIRRDYGFGRAIAAPQIGVKKRLICILTDRPYVIINPKLKFVGDEWMELMDDCMSFPNLLVRVRRCRHCILHYMDENWEEQEMHMDDDMSELIQHEYDHLDGILATMRAIDNKSFVMKKETRK